MWHITQDVHRRTVYRNTHVEKMSGAPGYFGNRAFFLCFLWSENTMQGNSTEFFTRTPPATLFFKASLPGAISMLASALYLSLIHI